MQTSRRSAVALALLPPGARLTLSRAGLAPRDVFLISATGTEIIALNLPDDLAVPRGVKRALIPDYDRVIQHTSRADIDSGGVRVENVSEKAPMPTSTKVWIGLGIVVGALYGTLIILLRSNP